MSNYYGPVTINNQTTVIFEIIGCYVPLSNSKEFAIVDEKYLNHLSQFKWFLTEEGYAQSTKWGMLMHRYIMQLEGKLEQYPQVDHVVSGNKLNNVVSNLRMCTAQENVRNRAKFANCTSIYRGVHRNKQTNKWKAGITHNYIPKHLGLFVNEEDAALAYDVALGALPIREEFKRYNFPVH